MEFTYENHLAETKSTLEAISKQLFSCIINLAMAGELTQINNKFNIGESIHYRREDFRGLRDINIKLIYEVLDSASNTLFLLEV